MDYFVTVREEVLREVASSVIAKNQCLALVVVMAFTDAFIGCLVGGIIFKLFSRLNKQY